MPTFAYKVKKNPEEFFSGTMEAKSERVVSLKLKRLGYSILDICEAKALSRDVSLSFRRITSSQVTLFTRQLSNLLNAGMPLEKSLTILIAQTENPKLVRVIESLRTQIQGGNTFHEALSLCPRVFSSLYVSLVHAGEVGGMLEKVLERLADYQEKEEELKGKVISSLSYPFLLIFVGITTIFVLITFVLPRFTTMFQDMGQILPLPTRVLINLSTVLQSYWWMAILGIVIITLLIKRLTSSGAGRLLLDQFKLKSPLFGKLLRKMEIAKFSRTLGTLLENGTSLLPALKIVARTITNQVIANEVDKTHKQISEGARLEESLRKSNQFSPMVVNMIAIGEESGNLEGVLSKLASAYDQEVDRTVKVLTSLLEPAMILVLGACIGFIVLSILLPIFQIDVLVR